MSDSLTLLGCEEGESWADVPLLVMVLQLPKWAVLILPRAVMPFPTGGFCTHRLPDPSLRKTGVQTDAVS